MSADGLAVEGLKNNPFIYTQGAQNDTGVPAAQKPYTVKDNIPSESALRFM